MARTKNSPNDGWTSTGVSTASMEALNRMSDELHMNKREVASLALIAFSKSDEYKQIRKDIEALVQLKEKYPGLTSKGGLLKN